MTVAGGACDGLEIGGDELADCDVERSGQGVSDHVCRTGLDTDDASSPRQHPSGFLEGQCAGGVQHDVETPGKRGGFEVEVDDAVDTEFACLGPGAGTAAAGRDGPVGRRELDGRSGRPRRGWVARCFYA